MRPDGQVAWRIVWSVSDATSQLASAVTAVLSAKGGPHNFTADAARADQVIE